ncbi:Outer membrane protein beta-barrel domain-containing protein [Catalinimonas alkaloidigena]|uniref:Outer membrane protein beta-barrel domain-containing protein n=1 Tax=Catalinimonas alkaloidigena TaxID=1075417 RepID=A0A1G8YA42_9BACT|nr:porin family protein [Catalinimonas alkaloidigena]SDJ99596.1 Outer membrane protein beta-barrel domain-containing protein [Catalinimonas alkaloidigena]
MKKLLFLGALLLCTWTARAQFGVHVGVLSGYHLSRVRDPQLHDSPNFQALRTFKPAPVGFTLGYHSSDEVGLLAQAIFTQLGQEYAVYLDDERVGTRSIDLNYLTVPLLVRFATSPKYRFGVHMSAGPQLSFLLKGQEYLDSDQEGERLYVARSKPTTDEPAFYSEMHQLNRFDLGGTVAAGMFFYVSKTVYLTAQFKMSANLRDMRSDDWIAAEESEYAADPEHYAGEMGRRRVSWSGVEVGLNYVLPFYAERNAHLRRRQ